MSDRIVRREALRRLAVFSATTLAAPWVVSCKSKPNCNDVSALTPEDVNQRQNVAQYVEVAPDAAKKCSLCAQYVPGAENACATCKVVKGPIAAEGGCKLWVAKPA